MKRHNKELNPEYPGVARTIKAQYWKTGGVNFVYMNDWGATRVMVYDET